MSTQKKNFFIPFFLSFALVLLLGFWAYKLADFSVSAPYPEEENRQISADEQKQSQDAPADTLPTNEEKTARADADSVQKDEPQPQPSARSIMGNEEKLVETVVGESGSEKSDMIDSLVKEGAISQEDSQKIKDWLRKNGGQTDITLVGATEQNGEAVKRYKLTGANGSVLSIEVKQNADGNSTISSVREIDTNPHSDPLALADRFMTAVRNGDIATARSLITGKQVNPATLAGLCMLFEDDLYAMRRRNPIRSMFMGSDRAGFLVYLQSKADKKSAHIGLEMQRANGQEWGISSVSLDSLLASYEQSGQMESGLYFPIVKNPKGGDSIALFFGFNESALTPRSQRQLSIIADLLKATNRRLEISGHTDDVGSAGFNYKLSVRRADAVKEALVRDGVDPSHIITKGMGKSQPRRRLGSATDREQVEEVRGENRRAEIYLDFTD